MGSGKPKEELVMSQSRLVNLISLAVKAAVMAGIVTILAWGVDHALSKSIYPGCTVVQEDGRLLTIEFNDNLCTGTDSACEEAEDVVKSILRSGFLVKIQDPEDHWTPFKGRIIKKLKDLNNY